jgi:redox-sensing transcriptional repressor
MALLDYSGFKDYGLDIIAAFDSDESKFAELNGQKPVYSMENLNRFCRIHDVKLGIITVPDRSAQSVCDALVACGIDAIWNFSSIILSAPDRVTISNENLALSLAHLHISQNH